MTIAEHIVCISLICLEELGTALHISGYSFIVISPAYMYVRKKYKTGNSWSNGNAFVEIAIKDPFG